MRVSNVVSYTEDIRTHRLIELFAGVGSGKNYFVNDLIKGHVDNLHNGTTKQLEPMTVLVITSRRSKADELLDEEDLPADGKVGKWDTYHQVFDPEFDEIKETGKIVYMETGWGEAPIFQRSVVCTNAFIERYLQYRYYPEDSSTHLWELFDLIVIDEAHSLVTDASYQSSPFYVMELIREFCARHQAAERDPEHHKAPRCSSWMLMTGSTEPMKQLTLPEKPYVIDLMDQCINVYPKQIHFLTKEEAKQQLYEQLAAGERAVYFINHTPSVAEFCKEGIITPEKIAVSFSKKEAREQLEKEDKAAFDRMVRVDQAIAKDKMIPDDIQLWVTTSRNTEGINIENKDIHYLYVENHSQSDLIQMGGRIRSGVEHMYVILDSADNYTPRWYNEADFCHQELVTSSGPEGSIFDVCNDYLEKLCIRYGIEGLFNMKNASIIAYAKKRGTTPVAEYIDYIHDKFDFIQYSYIDNVFRFYRMCDVSSKRQKRELEAFREAKEKVGGLERLFRMWFPESIVHPYIPLEERRMKEAKEYLEQIGFFIPGRRFTLDERDKLTVDLNGILGTKLTSATSVLKKVCPYKLGRVSGGTGTKNYNLFKPVPLPNAQVAS